MNYRIIKVVDPTKIRFNQSAFGKRDECNVHFVVEHNSNGYWAAFRNFCGIEIKFDYLPDAKAFINKKKNLKPERFVVWVGS